MSFREALLLKMITFIFEVSITDVSVSANDCKESKHFIKIVSSNTYLFSIYSNKSIIKEKGHMCSCKSTQVQVGLKIKSFGRFEFFPEEGFIDFDLKVVE